MSRRGVLGATAATFVVMAALVVASAGDSRDLLSRPVSSDTAPRVLRTDLTSPSLTPMPTAASSLPEGFNPANLFGVLLQVLVVLVVASALVLLVAAARALLRRATPHVIQHEAGFAVPDVPESLLANAEYRLDALRGGTPRNGIVAAWMSLEQDAADSGLPRQAAETTSEYTERVLRVWDVDRASIEHLAALFREARFSTHELSEQQRERAITALRHVHDGLARAARATVEGAPT